MKTRGRRLGEVVVLDVLRRVCRPFGAAACGSRACCCWAFGGTVCVKSRVHPPTRLLHQQAKEANRGWRSTYDAPQRSAYLLVGVEKSSLQSFLREARARPQSSSSRLVALTQGGAWCRAADIQASRARSDPLSFCNTSKSVLRVDCWHAPERVWTFLFGMML